MNQLECYMGIFDCYYPQRGCTRTLIMSGDFTHNDLYKVNILLIKEWNEYETNKI